MTRLDTTVAQIALRQRAETLIVRTTGSTTLGCDADGFTRTGGSFRDDGLAAGMEITPDGFPSLDRKVITQVTALNVKVRGGMSTVAPASGRTLSVGLPRDRRWEMQKIQPPTDIAPYIEEEWVPRPPWQQSFPAQGGTLNEYGLWVVRWYGLHDYDVHAIRRSVDAFLALFTPGTTITAGDHTLRVQGMSRGEPSPFAGQILRSGSHAVCAINIPLWAMTTNTIAA